MSLAPHPSAEAVAAAAVAECPVCVGRGTVPGRTRRTDGAPQHPCALCGGKGVILRAVVGSVLQLQQRMQRVADAMQAGQDDRAANEACRAAHLALDILEPHRKKKH